MKKKMPVFTIQESLIKAVDRAEDVNKDALKDIDSRLYQMVFAYSGAMDYGSMQILESIVLKTLNHIAWTKKQIAETYVKKDLENNPELNKQVQIIKSAIQKAHGFSGDLKGFSRN
jgi:hypothetical protein